MHIYITQQIVPPASRNVATLKSIYVNKYYNTWKVKRNERNVPKN